MNYQETIDWLFGLEAGGIKFGLDNTRELLRRLGNPHECFRSVHVGGTDGKGSVCAMIASVLREKGLRTGLYTSPHLVDFSERIVVNGIPIDKSEVLRLAEELRGHYEEMAAEGRRLTFFELTTALAFLHFRNEGVEVAVVEVGMGGRLDSTNLLSPLCTVVTRVGMEHTAYLGRTIAEIANEKAGIVKSGVPVVTGAEGEALEVIVRRADELGAPITILDRESGYEILESTFEGTRVRVADGKELFVPLAGSHQAFNVCLAYLALRQLREAGIEIDDETLRRGLERTVWPARLETISMSPRVLLDVTHTASGAEVVATELGRLSDSKLILVVGVLNDKDIDGIARAFGSISKVAIATAPRTKRAYPPEVVEAAMAKYCPVVIRIEGVGAAISTALEMAEESDTVLITGSLYTVGEAMRWFRGEGGRGDH